MLIEALNKNEYRYFPISTMGAITDAAKEDLDQIGLTKYFEIKELDLTSENYWERYEVCVKEYSDEEKAVNFAARDKEAGIRLIKNSIYSLERELDGDYRVYKRADGEYSDEEWNAIAAERRAVRQRLREYKELLEIEEGL